MRTEIKRRLRNDAQTALDFAAIIRPTSGKVSKSAPQKYGKVSNPTVSTSGKV